MPRKPENPYEPPVANSAAAPFSLAICHTSIILMGSATLFLLFVAGPLVWILKDGMGPDSTTSTGREALERMFWTFYWGPAAVTVMGIFLGTLYWRFRLGRLVGKR